MSTLTLYYNNPGTLTLFPPSGSGYSDEVILQNGPNEVDQGFWNAWIAANPGWTTEGIVPGDANTDGTTDDDTSPPDMIPEG